jgi:hypothetical protein
MENENTEYVFEEDRIYRRVEVNVEELSNLVATLESEVVQCEQRITEEEVTKAAKQAQIADLQALIAQAET